MTLNVVQYSKGRTNQCTGVLTSLDGNLHLVDGYLHLHKNQLLHHTHTLLSEYIAAYERGPCTARKYSNTHTHTTSLTTFSLKRMDHTDIKSKDFSSGNKTHTYSTHSLTDTIYTHGCDRGFDRLARL